MVDPLGRAAPTTGHPLEPFYLGLLGASMEIY